MKMEVKKMFKENKWFTKVLIGIRALVFLSLFITSFVFYRFVGNRVYAGIILLLAILFVILIRLDSLDRRLKNLEG